MIILLTIFQYLVQSTVDLMDKFLITARKVEPVKYTFYTLVTGLVVLVIWPWVYHSLPVKDILWDLFSGGMFALALFVFYKALAQGEVSRVVPFVFALVPVFDVVISLITGRDVLTLNEVAAITLLIPGALLISHQNNSNWGKHLALKTFSALLFSIYYAIWQYSAHSGPILNSLMWNRLGSALVLILPLVFSSYRQQVFAVDTVKNKTGTSLIFLFKQIVGGLNFIFFSFLLVLGKIAIVNGLQGFRYLFLIVFSLFLSKKRPHLIAEDANHTIFTQKFFGVALVFLGTIFLFI